MHSIRLQQTFCAVGLILTASAVVPGEATDSVTERLAEIGPAPEFELVTQREERLSLADLRGKVVALSFIYTRCPDVCPLLTVKMVGVQKSLGDDFGANVHFVSITMDPEVDSPEVLGAYAKALGCDSQGWSFLTGTNAEIRKVAEAFGVIYEKQPSGFVDHSLLTSLIDRQGTLRVQYMGHAFDHDEFTRDIRSLVRE